MLPVTTEAWADLPLPPDEHRVLVGILHRYSNHILGRPLRSAAFLEQVEAVGEGPAKASPVERDALR
jgi:hypothetical protein